MLQTDRARWLVAVEAASGTHKEAKLAQASIHRPRTCTSHA